MLSRGNRENILRELDALQVLLERRIPKGTAANIALVLGLETVFERYATVRERLLQADHSRFGMLPERRGEVHERDAGRGAYFYLDDLEALLNDVIQARTLIMGGASREWEDALASTKAERRLKHLKGAQIVGGLVLSFASFAVGLGVGTCIRSMPPNRARAVAPHTAGPSQVDSINR